MEKQQPSFWTRFLATLTGLLLWCGAMALLPSKQQAFVKAHLFLVLFVPLAVLFLILFCLSYYLQYKD